MNRRKFLQQLMLFSGGISSPGLLNEMNQASATPKRETVFSAQQRASCTIACELIIPTTDTPGAKAAGVPAFIEYMVSHWYTKRERVLFFEGLEAMSNFCRDQYDRSFHQCSEIQQIAALSEMEARAASYVPPAQGFGFKPNVDEESPFFLKLRELTVVGYYTSEVGATQEHIYDPMPMQYDGDADLSTYQRHRRN
jgi:hypothetical protein